jgi:hypothetical protein
MGNAVIGNSDDHALRPDVTTRPIACVPSVSLRRAVLITPLLVFGVVAAADAGPIRTVFVIAMENHNRM